MTDRDPFDQLAGTFDRPVAPAPAFAERLRARLISELADGRQHSTNERRARPVSGGAEETAMIDSDRFSPNRNGAARFVPPSLSTPAATPRPGRSVRSTPRLLRWLPALEIAAAVLLVLTIFNQWLVPGEPQTNQASNVAQLAGSADALAASPAPSRTADASNVSMWGANPGRTWNFPGNAPPISGSSLTQPVAGTAELLSSAVIHGDRLFRSMINPRASGGNSVQAVDLETGETLWATTEPAYGRMTATDRALFLVSGPKFPAAPDDPARDMSGTLIALDAETGVPLWTGPEIGPLADNPHIGPIVVGDMVYLARPQGQVLAVDPGNGTIQWQSPALGGDRSDRPDPDEDTFQPIPGGTLAADETTVYTVTSEGQVEAYDLLSGALRWSIQLGEPDAEVVSASLIVHGDRLFVVTQRGVITEDPNVPVHLIPGTISALSTADGDTEWSNTLGLSVGEPVVASDTIVVPQHPAIDAPSNLIAYNLGSGDEQWQLDLHLERRALVVSVVGDRLFALRSDGELIVSEDGQIRDRLTLQPPARNENTFVIPPWLEAGGMYVIRGDGGVFAIAGETTSSPDASPQASPIAAEGTAAAMWGANAGRTWEFEGSVKESGPGAPTVVQATEGVDNAAAGVVSGDTLVRVIAGSDGPVRTSQLEALSLSTGERQWIMPLGIATIPAVVDGRVFVVTAEFGREDTETFVLALDLATGSEVWRSPIAGPRTTTWTAVPLVVDSTVFIADDVGNVHALDIENGTLRWQAPRAAERSTEASGEQLLQTAGMMAANTDHLYVTTAVAELHALDLDTGELAWRVPLAPQYGSLYLYANVMADGSTVMLDLVSGDQSQAPSGGTEVTAATIVSLDAQSGQQRWIRRGVPPTSVRVLADGLVITALLDDRASDGSASIAALRTEDGSDVWQNVDLPIQSRLMSVAGGQIVAVDPRGTLVALDLTSGDSVWEATLPVAATGPPIVTGDHIVVLGAQGDIALYAGAVADPSRPLPSPTQAVATPLTSPAADAL